MNNLKQSPILLGVVVLTLVPMIMGISWDNSPELTLTPSNQPPTLAIGPDFDIQPFPTGLYCPQIDPPFWGPSWEDITVGTSTIDDLRDYVYQLSTDYEEAAIGNQLDFYLHRSQASRLEIPSVIRVCLNDKHRLVIAIQTVSPPNQNPILEEMVKLYGVPDTVTWSHIPRRRVVFWFSEGIAAHIDATASESSGEIHGIVYFPYRPVEGYETRWPYNRTAYFGMVEPPEAQNPFDFDAIVATITARPSRIPTLTFTPWPRQAATPTPEPTSVSN